MMILALTLLLLAAQPDDSPVSTQQVVPPPSPAALDEVRRRAAAQAAKDEAEQERALEEWRTASTPPPEPTATPAPDMPKLTFDEAVAASRAARNPAVPRGRLGFPTPAQPQTEEERIAAANAAALARAEQAGQETNAPPGAWPDDGRMRCKPTDNGIVCGNSDAALEPDSPSRQALDALLTPD